MSNGILLPYQKRWVADTSRFKIWLAARQIGKSFGSTLEPALESVSSKSNWVYLSVGERQARELAEKTKTHLEAIKAGAVELEDYFFDGSERYAQLEYRLPNGARHIFLPANPATARGYTANLFLDEFAFHKDSRLIWTALYPSITRRSDLKIRIASTPNGKSNKFYDIWEGRDERSSGRQVWSRHRTDTKRRRLCTVGVSIKGNFNGLVKALEKASKPDTKNRLGKPIGAAMVASTRERFRDSKGPDGKPWKPLSDKTVKAGFKRKDYKKSGGVKKAAAEREAQRKILVGPQARLKNSISSDASETQVAVGTNMVYARIHQLGGRTGRGGKTTIPARPYLGVSKSDEQEIERLTKNFVEDAFG